MIPSHFMIVSTFPLSPNGKVDRNSLPEISSLALSKEDTYIAPTTELEKTIVNIWKQLVYKHRLPSNGSDLNSSNTNEIISPTCHSDSNCSYQETQISASTNFFDLGGDSLLLIQLYQHYQSLFNFDTEVLSIRPFFEFNTIVEHAKLIETIIRDDMQSKQWHTLHINEGKTFLNYIYLTKYETF